MVSQDLVIMVLGLTSTNKLKKSNDEQKFNL
jgi:hypothetical protein